MSKTRIGIYSGSDSSLLEIAKIMCFISTFYNEVLLRYVRINNCAFVDLFTVVIFSDERKKRIDDLSITSNNNNTSYN